MFLMASASQHHPDLHPHRRNSVFCRENLSERIACASGVSGALGVVSQAQARDRYAVNIQSQQSSHPWRLHSRESTASGISFAFCWTAAVSLGSTIACSGAVPAMVTAVPSGPTMFWVV